MLNAFPQHDTYFNPLPILCLLSCALFSNVLWYRKSLSNRHLWNNSPGKFFSSNYHTDWILLHDTRNEYVHIILEKQRKPLTICITMSEKHFQTQKIKRLRVALKNDNACTANDLCHSIITGIYLRLSQRHRSVQFGKTLPGRNA